MSAHTMINIRRANLQDCDAIWAVRTAAIQGISLSFYTEYEISTWVSTLRPDNFEDVVRRLEWHVAEYDNRIVGCGFLDKESGEIGGVFVHPRYQRKKIGAQILVVLEAVARENNIKKLYLDATLNAENFYKSLGYQSLKYDKCPHISKLAFACVRMEKAL